MNAPAAIDGDRHGFDVVLIGAGPAALAALDGLPTSLRIAVLTGAVTEAVPARWLHPKIRAVAVNAGVPAGVAEPLTRGAETTNRLFSTAAVGGLANYWGQQVVRFDRHDPWPDAVFASHEDYLDECRSVERLFSITGGTAIERGPLDDDHALSVPRLLTGSARDPTCGLDSMSAVFAALAQARGATVLDRRARRLDLDGDRRTIELDDGTTITGRAILLAAGVLGDARLLMRSFPDLATTRFADHTPWMVYTTGLRGLVRARPRTAPRHFNALTLEQGSGGPCSAFGSIYDMTRSDLNLLLASTLGLTSPWLRRWPAPPGASLVTPVQVWTATTVDAIRLDQGAASVATLPRATNDAAVDPALQRVLATLRRAGGRPLGASRTAPGLGYHYHDLRVSADGARFLDVAPYLRERTSGVVTAIDASTMTSVGCRPHTLTAMATARRVAQRLQLA